MAVATWGAESLLETITESAAGAGDAWSSLISVAPGQEKLIRLERVDVAPDEDWAAYLYRARSATDRADHPIDIVRLTSAGVNAVFQVPSGFYVVRVKAVEAGAADVVSAEVYVSESDSNLGIAT
jgi:hypothetical protein